MVSSSLEGGGREGGGRERGRREEGGGRADNTYITVFSNTTQWPFNLFSNKTQQSLTYPQWTYPAIKTATINLSSNTIERLLNLPIEPALHLSHAHAGPVKVHVLPVLAVHAQGLLGRLAALLVELQLGHAVEQLGQVLGHLQGRGKGRGLLCSV